MIEQNSKKILPITLFIIAISMIIIQWGSINTLEKKINDLENYSNVWSFEDSEFKPSRLPLWRECNNGKQIGKPLAYALVLVNKDYMIKVPDDKLAFKNGTLYECIGSLVK